ncbi:hypothetical protein FPQ18DRAFT_329483 [Pyronema domesticum]|nr:hypothetical protein FPQ18DRAFT_329483 [Pyronema domesticum]
MSFGYSIGDFITVANLAGSIAKALSDSRGAKVDYENLIELLESIQTSLQVVYNFLVSSSLATDVPPPDAALMRGLRMEMDCCQKLMHRFLETSRKYTESLIHTNTFSIPNLNNLGWKSLIPWCKTKHPMVIDEFRKIKFALYRAEDARNLER